MAEDQQGLPPDFHNDQALLLPGHIAITGHLPAAALPLLDQVLDLHERRNGAGVIAPPMERHIDGSAMPCEPLHIGSSFEGRRIHIQVRVHGQALDAVYQTMRARDGQGLLRQRDELVVQQDAALKRQGHEGREEQEVR